MTMTPNRYLEEGQPSPSGRRNVAVGSTIGGSGQAANARQMMTPFRPEECLQRSFTGPRQGLPSLLPMGTFHPLSPTREGAWGNALGAWAQILEAEGVDTADRIDLGVMVMAQGGRRQNPVRE